MPAITKLSKKQEKAAKFKKGQLKKEEKTTKATEEGSADVQSADNDKPAKPQKPKGQKRNTLFIGNLPYDIDTETLSQHFGNAKPDNIRMRKGFAFFDFNSSETLQLALRYHHSTLKYRKINVELTAGGGGQSKVRKDKIEKKNKAMHEELADLVEREAKQAEAKREEKRKKSSSEIKQEKKQLQKDLENVHPSRRQNFNGPQ